MSIDPKSLEFNVKASILSYPSLFQIREQVVVNLYCTLGNGYDWWDGYLQLKVPDEKHETVERMLIEGKSEDEIMAWVKEQDNDRVEKSFQELKDLCKRLDIPWEPPPLSMHPLRIYPLCHLCAIMKLPDYIRPDWLDGAEEVARLIEVTQSFDEKATEENRKLLPVIRERISVLKAKRPEAGGGMSSMMLAI